MRISYCTTCHGRLWQLKQTLDHNLAFTQKGSVEICILAYNDSETYQYLHEHYGDYIDDGRLRVLSVFKNKIFADGSDWSCGYVKHLAHLMGRGDVLFNLDADNFIDDPLHNALLSLQPNELLITLQSEWRADGRSGRIGVHSNMYGQIMYSDKGRDDDGDFIRQCLRHGAKLKQIRCRYKPVSNDKTHQKEKSWPNQPPSSPWPQLYAPT